MLVKQPSKFKQTLSYLFPVILYKKRMSSDLNLVIQMYKKQYQLAYGRVFYSDGFDYFPVKSSLQKIGVDNIPTNTNFLCLGSGLGSLTMVLDHLFPSQPFTIEYVDINTDILEVCEELTKTHYPHIHHEYKLADANVFMKLNQNNYQHVMVDIFEEHLVPEFVFKAPFIEQLHRAVAEGGHLVMNMMFSSTFQEHKFDIKFSQLFPQYEVISTRKNKIYIAKK